MTDSTRNAVSTTTALPHVLDNLRRRLLGFGLLSGLGWGGAAGAIVFGACAWLDLALELSPALRVGCGIASLGLGAVLVVWAGSAAVLRGDRAALARRLDRTAGTGGQILSGVELFSQYYAPPRSDYVYMRSATSTAAAQPLSAALAAIAVDRASRLAAGVRAAAAIPASMLYRPYAATGLVLIMAALLALLAPRLAATQWARFTDPYGDHPPYSSIEFKVDPGNTRFLYGSGLEVRVTTEGGTPDQLELVLEPSIASAASVETLPMFPEPDGAWRASVANVTDPGVYFIRVHGRRGARSQRYTYDVITVPELKNVRFKVTPPAYTHRPPYEGPLPQAGLAGLPGTRVDCVATSNRPLSAGSLRFAPAAGADTRPSEPSPGASIVTLSPTSLGASEVAGSFVITSPGKIEVKVIDSQGQPSRDSLSAPVKVLSDDRPFVRILEPKANSYATPNVKLGISLLSEDDYGISRVQLYRGLNESRVRATEVPVPPSQPTRLPAIVPLDLADYGLNPGDEVKIYARVEDNDPAGPKGYECPVVVVHIISEEQMRQMTLAREGMEVLQSKYDQANRRLEALDKQLDDLQKQLEKAEKDDPNSELAKEVRDKLEKLSDQASDAAGEVAKMAAEDLPFDIDKALKKQLDEVAQTLEHTADDAGKLAKKPGISTASAKKSVEELRKKLGLQREQLQQEATDPLDYLAKIFPLKEDEARFVDLYQRQRDLAERMRSIEDMQASDPAAKTRMRDLEAEQRKLLEDLQQLLGDIDSHIAALPDDKKLDDLRNTAKAFADAVGKSDAAEKMAASGSALSEFASSQAILRAREAADTLEKFISQCNGMGDQAGTCLKFQPKLAAGLGDSVEQLLATEGLGKKFGNGTGSGGGFSQRRSTLNNVGLYGTLPQMTRRQQNSRGGRSQPGAAAGGSRDPNDPGDTSGTGAAERLRAAGESNAAVPAQYRKKVGDYFQRVSDELGEEK